MTRFSFGAEGNTHFLRSVAAAQEASLEYFFEDEHWEYSPYYFSNLPALRHSQRPTALGGMEVLGVFLAFVASAFAKKIFDEVYDRTAKRPIGQFLDTLFAKAASPRKPIEFRDVIYLFDIDLVVVVRVVVSKADVVNAEDWLLTAHRIAHEYIQKNGRKAPIHCHRVDQGRVQLEPELFENIEQIKKHDIAMVRERKI